MLEAAEVPSFDQNDFPVRTLVVLLKIWFILESQAIVL